jgi:hypothetical protein
MLLCLWLMLDYEEFWVCCVVMVMWWYWSDCTRVLGIDGGVEPGGASLQRATSVPSSLRLYIFCPFSQLPHQFQTSIPHFLVAY